MRDMKRHIPYVLMAVIAVFSMFLGYTGGLGPYTAWLIGAGGCFLLFVLVFAWVVVHSSERRRGTVLLTSGVLTAVLYLPLSIEFGEILRAPDLYARITGNMEATFSLIPAIIAAVSIFHGVRLIAKNKESNRVGGGI
jgi:hypothetical protein